MTKPNQMGGTFAERTAAASGASSFKDPRPTDPGAQENTTFAERAQAAKKAPAKKAVEADDDKAENKAVKSAAKKS